SYRLPDPRLCGPGLSLCTASYSGRGGDHALARDPWSPGEASGRVGGFLRHPIKTYQPIFFVCSQIIFVLILCRASAINDLHDGGCMRFFLSLISLFLAVPLLLNCPALAVEPAVGY